MILLGFAAAEENNGATRCRALALSGGGAKGAYEAGVLHGFYHNMFEKDIFYYDVVTGVSAGAINTLALALFKPDEMEKAIDFMSN